jgi:hypothetical protein
MGYYDPKKARRDERRRKAKLTDRFGEKIAFLEKLVKAGEARYRRGTKNLIVLYLPRFDGTFVSDILEDKSFGLAFDFSKCQTMTLAEAHYHITNGGFAPAEELVFLDHVNEWARQHGEVEDIDACDTPCVRFCAGGVALVYEPRSGRIITLMNPAGKEIFDFSKSRRMSRETARRVVARSLYLSEDEKAFHLSTIDAPTDADTDAKNNNLT